jgi:succinate-semialdehyde dehydrogenase/glutarate-semialdehyde dehydrogenase
MMEYRELLSYVMAMEMGKPVREGLREVEYAAGFYFWFAGEAERIYGQTIPSQHSNKRLMLVHEPIGVCAIITPWNFPIAMGARKIAAALAAGCTVVAKPSPECPVSMALVALMCQIAQVPPGVFNMLIGSEEEIGRAFLESEVVRKISFTGSCEVGKYLYKNSADTLKRLTLELGGHAPLLVFNDASIKKAVQGSLIAKFRNNGQTCVAANRFFIQNEIYDDYLNSLLESIQRLRIGDPLDHDTDLSTVLHPSAISKVKKHTQDALQKGAIPILLGREPYEPTVLTEVTPDMLVFKEETFGPLIAIMRFQSIEEGIALANQSPYGLASYAFTENLTTAYKIIDQLQYGIIGLNDGLPSTPQASFGGIKNSGFGREGGPSGLREYLVEKFVSLIV